MNIASTNLRPAVVAKAKTHAAPAQEAPAEQAPVAEADTVSISVPLPRHLMRRSVSTGIGAAMGLGIGSLMGGGWSSGLALGAMALGGLAGAVLSSDTVANAAGSYLAARKEAKIQKRVAAESSVQAEQMVQARIQEEAERKFEVQWAQSGKELVEARVEARLAERVEAEAAPKVEEQFGKKFNAVVSEKVDSKLKAESGRIDEEVTSRVQQRIDQMVEKSVEEKSKTEVEQRVGAQVSERVEKALKERGEEIEGKVESGVQAAIDAEIKQKLEARKAPGSQAAELELHYKLAVSASQKSYAAGADVLKDGLEIVADTSESMPAADRQLVNLILDKSAGDDWITPQWKEYSTRSRFKAREQALLVLKKSSAAEAGSLNPKSYLDVLTIPNNTWDSGRLLMRSGLQVLAEKGDLTPSEKMLAEKALSHTGMDTNAEYQHLSNVLKLLAGQNI